MKRCVLFLLPTLFALTAYSQVASPTGVTLQTGDHQEKLFLASSSGVKSSGVAKMAFSYGIASAKMVLIFRDPTAPVKTSTPRPELHLTGYPNVAPRDIVIVRLQQKKDHRELQTGKINAYSGSQFEYPPADTFEVDVKDVGTERIVTPKVDLKPGEYIVFAGAPTPMPTGYGGYDFSIQ